MADLNQDILQTSITNADQLNRNCYCITLDREALNEGLNKQFVDAESGVAKTTCQLGTPLCGHCG